MSLKCRRAAQLVLSVVTHHSAGMTGICPHPNHRERSPAASSVSEKEKGIQIQQPNIVNITDDAC